MPDISMCLNVKCEKRYSCYRYRAVPSVYMQSYIKPDKDSCNHYWQIKDSSQELRTVFDADGINKKHTVNADEN